MKQLILILSVISVILLTACSNTTDLSNQSNVPRSQQEVGSSFNPAGNAKVTKSGNTTTFTYPERDVNESCKISNDPVSGKTEWSCTQRQ